MDITQVVADLQAEQEDLDAVVADLTDEQWQSPSASERWSVADQIGHLAYFDGTAAQAITDPDGFDASRKVLFGSLSGSPEEADAATLGSYRQMSGTELLTAWRAQRQLLSDAGAQLSNEDRIPWYGPSMGSKSFITARLMECWAHGQHVCDAVQRTRIPTDRLRHIAQLGVITRGWTYVNRGLEVPETDVHVELSSPSGETWMWGDPASSDRVTGPAEDFCLVVTQCRNVGGTALDLQGEAATEWMTMAQAFAGAATDGPGA